MITFIKSMWLLHQFWVKEILFTCKWWFELSLSIIPWIIWIIYRRRESTNRLLFVGAVIALIVSWFDFEGIQLGLWAYETALIPSIPTFLPWDFTLIPILVMVSIEIKPKANSFVKSLILSAGSSYIAEPFFKWIGLYDPKDWKFTYSFAIYIWIYLFAHYLSKRGNFENL